jgi:hypothetical protein
MNRLLNLNSRMGKVICLIVLALVVSGVYTTSAQAVKATTVTKINNQQSERQLCKQPGTVATRILKSCR